MTDYLGDNLKLLCSHYRSIAEVCRKLAINRAQFNRYLAGQSRPTRHNLKRICDFFGVEEYELGQPPEQFARLIGVRPQGSLRPPADPLLELFEPLRAHASSLARYCGYYFEYANCLSVPGRPPVSRPPASQGFREARTSDLACVNIRPQQQGQGRLPLAVERVRLIPSASGGFASCRRWEKTAAPRAPRQRGQAGPAAKHNRDFTPRPPR